MKQYISAVLEDLVGEYVLNISKEKLKISTIKGKIKLENVELDGDFIGSHILSAMGLSGFGVLSCWARRLQINIPWKNLDNEPTSLEIRGVHLICVPLLPSTANRVYYGGGTDSTLSLRTRAKRAALARFERRFFSGKIPGEELVQQNGHDGDDGGVLSYNGRRRRYSSSEDVGDDNRDDFEEGDAINESLRGNNDTSKKKKEARIPALKRKLKAKVYGNLVSSVSDIHIRFEVPEGGLDSTASSPSRPEISDERAFAFGLTLKSLTARNVSGDESTGSIDTEASNHTADTKRKKIDIQDLSIYWDDGPSFLISETDLFTGKLTLPTSVCQQNIADTMQKMSHRIDPGVDARKSLSCKHSKLSFASTDGNEGHDYICSNVSQSMLTTFCKGEDEDSLYFVEILPSDIELNLTPQQYLQHKRLKDAVLAQQRFDTMIYQRPSKSPINCPRLWWQYAIACVRHNPTSRSWTDVQKIVQCRKTYIDLVMKNLLCESERSGFHGGLTTEESRMLLELESLLPIETLLSFHLLALRRVLQSRFESVSVPRTKSTQSIRASFTRRRSSSSLGRRLFNSFTGTSNSFYGSEDDGFSSSLLRRDSSVIQEDRVTVPSLLEDDKISAEGPTPTTHTTCKLHTCGIKLSLLDSSSQRKGVMIQFDFRGTSYDSGTRSEITFDITKFDVFDFVTSGAEKGIKVLTVEIDKDEFPDIGLSTPFMSSREFYEAPILQPSVSQSQLEAEPLSHGSVCQVIARVDGLDFSLDLSAHPATVLWNQECASFLLEWSASVMSVSQFINQLQNATTPGAHRAQIALLYPTSFSLSLDISTPKLWIPVSTELSDGALLLDAGRLNIDISKPKQSLQTGISADIGNINILLAREVRGFDVERDTDDLTFLIRAEKKFVNIVQPFQIQITAESGRVGDIDDEEEEDGISQVVDGIKAGKVSVMVGAISLNLIDVEKLSKAIGRLLASGVSRMRQISESGVLAEANRIYSTSQSATSQSHATDFRIYVESVEMLLQNYSSSPESSRSSRTYLVEILRIRIHRRSMGMKSFSRFSIHDAKVQLAETECGARRLKSGAEQIFSSNLAPQEQVEGCDISTSLAAPRTPSRQKERSVEYKTPLRTPKSLSVFPVTPKESPSSALTPHLIQGCHFHDGENHGDEIEFDVMPAIIKITPTSIQDCAGAMKRLFECGLLISREMERRVHESGRLARASSNNRGNNGTASKIFNKDSSLLFRVTMKDATILMGRPASDFTFHRNSTRSDYVIQIITKASFIGQSIENDDGTGSRTHHLSIGDFSASVNNTFDRVKLVGTSPMLVAPTSADVRAVYKTAEEGRTVSQDFSFDIENWVMSAIPHDLYVVESIGRKVLEKLDLVSKRGIGKRLWPFLHSKKKGSSIRTSIKAELQKFSFVMMRAFRPKNLVRPFVDVHAAQMKLNVEGCAAFLADFSLLLGVKFYNPNTLEWEDLMEQNNLLVATELLPSETMVSMSFNDVIRTNCSAILIREIANLEQVKNTSIDDVEQCHQGDRIYFVNETGLAASIGLPEDNEHERLRILPGETCILDPSFRGYTLSLDDSCSSYCSLSLADVPSTSGKSLYRLGSCDSFNAEPVVEFVYENQRLIPDITSVYSVERGQDLLDAEVWSPAVSSGKERKWLPPYHLEGDAPQWSDSTCTTSRTRDSVELPDMSWVWIDEWEVDVGTDTDEDGWEYSADFAFGHTRRKYRRGDSCRRRRWSRTRVMKRKSSPSSDILSNVYMVVETMKEAGSITIKARSRFKFVNETSLSLSILGLKDLQDAGILLGSIAPTQTLCVPLPQSNTSFIRLALSSHFRNWLIGEATEPILIIPTGFSSNRVIRTSFRCNSTNKIYHLLLHIESEKGAVNITIQPVMKLLNLLPCELQIQLGEMRKGNIEETEEITIGTGDETHCSVDCRKKPHISIRVPGYNWSQWNMIINRVLNEQTWLPKEEDEGRLYETSNDDPHATEIKTILMLEHACRDAPHLKLILSVEPGHIPVIRVYAQYWVIDKTALGLIFTERSSHLGSQPDQESLRTTYLSRSAEKHIPNLYMDADGHQWSLGMSGMTLFYSAEKTISFAVGGESSSSRWSSSIDVAKSMPETVKTAISVDAVDGSKRFELAYSVTVCPSLFCRTSVIAFFPRYQVVNLIGEEIYVAQEGALEHSTQVSTQSGVHISGLDSQLPPKIRFSVAPDFDLWTSGAIQLDKVGITSIRIPTRTESTLIVQCEVRLASKKQDSAVVIVVWKSNEKQNPLYLLRNTTHKTVFCSQLLSQSTESQTPQQSQNLSFVDMLQCGSGLDSFDDDDDGIFNAFVWTLGPGESKVFGFCNPEKSHRLQWSVNKSDLFMQCANTIDVDTVGSSGSCVISNGKELNCKVQADMSTKVVLFSCDDDNDVSYVDFASGIEDDFVAFSVNIVLPGVQVSVVDNSSNDLSAREIFLVNVEDWKVTVAQSREGFHEFEVKLASLQVDNFIFDTNHRVMLSSKVKEEDFLHMTLVRRLQENEATVVLSYVAFKLLDVDICLDRKTAETITRFLHPFHRSKEERIDKNWIAALTKKLSTRYSRVRVKASHEIEKMAYTANTGRLYIEHLHIHPIRFYLTFTQQDVDIISSDAVSEDFTAQFIRDMASITNAPIIFTSFIVSNAFESSSSLTGIIGAHYSSQLSNQMFSVLGSLTILKVPADFLSNVGNGVKDFFYEPIQGLVHGPEEFLVGLEAGTFSLARGVVVAFVRGAADVTYLLSDTFATLTSDEAFIGERNLYNKQLMYANSNQRTVQDTFAIAGTKVARGFQSALSGIVEQPRAHFSRQGASGLVIGAGLGIFGAIVKPVVGLGDAAVVVMNHGLEATAASSLKGNRRLRRALPTVSSGSEIKTKMISYDEISAKIQQQVTKGETVDDVYLGHVLTEEHLLIASDKYLWIFLNESIEARCIDWNIISYFEPISGYGMKIDVFTKQGSQSQMLRMGENEISSLRKLLQLKLDESSLVSMSYANLPGIKANQGDHVFGSLNIPVELDELDDEDSIIQSCHDRVNMLGSFIPHYFRDLDQEAWLLINVLTQLFSGLSSRRCVVVGLINATNESIQIKATDMVEGSSLCHVIPTIEYDTNNAVLHPGGVLLCVGWGAVPSSTQAGRVRIGIETNAFACSLADSISETSSVEVLSGYRVGFLEKSFDESGWWAKYWMLLQADNSKDGQVVHS